ncbi:MAG: hypothetical protein AB1458_16380, partial [Bacteroidota bacterium]
MLILVSIPSYGWSPSKRDSLHYSKVQLAAPPADSALYVRDSVTPSHTCANSVIKKAELKAYLYMGETYTLGSLPFTGQVNLKISAYSTYWGNSSLYDIYWVSLNVNQGKPEELFLRDFTSDHGIIDRFVVKVVSTTIPSGTRGDSLQVAVYYEEEFGVDVAGVNIDNATISSLVSPVVFKWKKIVSGGCRQIPNYQVQVLRLYNTNSAYSGTETSITATVDWDQALTVETGSSDTTLTLNLVEGTGYYIWRVRPIGTYYEGGIADSRNWGSWSESTYADGSTHTITSTATTADKFFYTQFDDTLNWIYSRTFSEGDPASPKVRISEKMTYANGLQMVKQNQAYLPSQHVVLLNQTIYDWTGRAALNTLSAPYESDSIKYRKQMLKVGSNIYTASNFDDDANYNNPTAADGGLIYTYYSNSNTDVYVPNSEGYPYARSLYEKDATGRVKEQGGPGGTHRIKTTDSHTTKTFYGGVSDQELIRIFGDEAPDADGVHKVVNVDANYIASVSYMSKEGQVIATCLAVVDSTLLDTLPGQYTAQFSVSDTIKGSTPYGQYGIVSSKPLVLATPTTVTFTYKITAKDIKHLCMNYCRNCDYAIEFLIKSDASTTRITKTIPANICTTPKPKWDTTFSMNLAAGSYMIEKRIFANSIKTAATDSTNAVYYLDDHLKNLKKQLQDTADAKLACVYNNLKTSNLTGLYGASCLNINTNVSNPDSVFADSSKSFNIGCATISIPILVCPSYDCSDSTPNFEAHFNKVWAGTHYVGTSGGYLKYFPNNLSAGKIGYRPGEFNKVIDSMVAQNGWNGYDCQSLWKCWDQLVQNYATLDTLSDTLGTYDLNLLREFLNCTGTKYKGYAKVANDSAKWKYQPYAYFYYAKGDKPDCDSALKVQYGTEPWAQDSVRGYPQNQKYKNYRDCVENYKKPSKQTPYTGLADAQCGCYGTCEGRYQSFIEKLILMYHNDSIYVEGDVYKLKRDTTWGQVYGFSTDLLSGQPGAAYYRTMAEIECAARSLVDECKKSCELTVYKTGSHVDSVGTKAQIEAMKKAMTWTFDLKRPSCSGGWTSVPPPASTNDTLMTIWEKHFGATKDDHLWDIVEVKKGCGGYLLAGWTIDTDTTLDISYPGKGTKDYWLIKVNQSGVKEWDLRFGGSVTDSLRTIFQTADEGFIIGGSSKSNISGDKSDNSESNTFDYWVVKIDAVGNIEWNKTYGGTSTDMLQSVTETSDGKYLLGGFSNSARNTGTKTDTCYWDPPSYDYWLVKLNHKGTKIWDRTYGGTSDDKLYSVRETPDKKYILAGHSASAMGSGTSGNKTSGQAGGIDYWVIKTDTAGKSLWQTTYGGTSSDYLYSMEPIKYVSDSGFILAGVSNSSSLADGGSADAGTYKGKSQSAYSGSYDYWVIRIDKNGNKVWDKIYGGTDTEGPNTDRYVDIKETKKMGFVVGGSSKSAKNTGNKVDSLYNSSYDYWVVRIDSSGNKKWDRSLGGSEADYFTSIDVDNNYDFWMAGYSYSDSSTSATNGNKKRINYDNTLATADYWVIKGREKCTHDTLCFKWVQPPTRPDSINTYYNVLSCDSMSALAIYNAIQLQVANYIQQQLDDFKAKYIVTCASADSIRDTFRLSYNLKYHHYTLYYYDRA